MIPRDQNSRLSDRELLEKAKRLAAVERGATVDVIAALSEIDERQLYLGEGYSSMFVYCTRALRYSEHAAYGRIEAARLARRFPVILELLGNGSVTLTTIALLASHFTESNHADLLSASTGKSKREVERLVAALSPRPDARSSIRKLAATGSAVPLPAPDSSESEPFSDGRATAVMRQPDEAAPALDQVAELASRGAQSAQRPTLSEAIATCQTVSPTQPAIVKPIAPERYSLRVTISREAHDHLRRAQDLLRHSIPSGDPARVVERALALLVADLERRKLAAVRRPRQARKTVVKRRHVPATVKREVWQRDGGRCAFEGSDGRCNERGFLELHHVIPFAEGGTTDAANLQLRCRAHNVYEAEQWFGPSVVREAMAAGSALTHEPAGECHRYGSPRR